MRRVVMICSLVAAASATSAFSQPLARPAQDVAKDAARKPDEMVMLDATSDVLRNPADAHDKIVFDPAIRGHTDQFALRFKKP